jgi:hypothetical protein
MCRWSFEFSGSFLCVADLLFPRFGWELQFLEMLIKYVQLQSVISQNALFFKKIYTRFSPVLTTTPVFLICIILAVFVSLYVIATLKIFNTSLWLTQALSHFQYRVVESPCARDSNCSVFCNALCSTGRHKILSVGIASLWNNNRRKYWKPG